jgi:ribosomal protein S18 acetylase RimI-like enzyme
VITHRLHNRADLGRLLGGLSSWDADSAGGAVPGLHVGDVGWALRDPDEAWSLHGWWDNATLLAVALCEGPVARPRVSPRHVSDRPLAEAVVNVVEALPGDRLWSDAPRGTQLRDVFESRGWLDDADDPWVCLHLDLRSWGGPSVPADEAHTCVGDRVAVQVAGFEGSSFTEEKWRRMSAGSVYRPSLDLVVREIEGTATAAGTAWLGVPGGSAVLEPVATHRDHRRAGHGTRLVQALAAACRDAAAQGVTVWTPRANGAAVAAYRAAGFAVVAEATSVWLDRSP